MTDDRTKEAVVIGGSAGSLDALSAILAELPGEFTLPVFVVVHLPPDRHSVLPELLQNKCVLPVREAQDKEPISAGTVYFAPPDYHLLVEQDRHCSLSYDEPHLFSRPSIDVLFESAADVYGCGLIGVVLSGANNDGAQGLAAVAREGGFPVVQSPEEAAASAMPLSAIEACARAMVLTASDIGKFLKRKGAP